MAIATAATQPASDMGTFRMVDIGLIDFSKSNAGRAKSYDKKRLDELAKSIREKGVIEPVVLRPRPGGRFQCVAGERRTRASKLADKTQVKAEIRELSDEDVLELQVIENVQREDVHPLDEAEGYQALMAVNPEKHTPEHIAVAVGKSESYVYQRLKLLALVGKAQKMFCEGHIGPAHAILLARLQPKDQGRALEDVFRHDDSVTVGRLRNYIERDIMLDLKKAAFDPADASLVPAAGACLSCPKRTGCAPALFEDIKSGDTCTDPGCYQQKESAGLEAIVVTLQAKHGAEQVVKIDPSYYGYGSEAKKQEAKDRGILLSGAFIDAGKDVCDDTRIAVAFGTNYGEKLGATKKVCIAPKTCKVHKEKRPSYSSGHSSSPAVKARERKQRHEQKVYPLAKVAVFNAAMAKVTTINVGDLRMLAAAAFDRATYDGKKSLVALMGWDESVWGKSGFLEKQVAGMAEPQLLRLLYASSLAEDLAAPHSYHSGIKKSESLDAFAKRWKVDAVGIEKKIRAEHPLKAPTKAKANAKKKAAPAKVAKKAKKR